MAVTDLARGERIDSEMRGLDALELDDQPRSGGRRLWSVTWPKLAAVAMAVGLWQVVVEAGWRNEFALPSPFTVFDTVGGRILTADFAEAVGNTLQRALTGYALALVIGVTIGAAVARVRVLRAAVGSLITGLQTMPSIAWFPAAILLFARTEAAILFVVVIGAAPSVANGLIAGVDSVPTLLLRAGRVLGARGLATWRHVVLPAALPSFLGGMKQGWAFAWRSLMAGELLVVIANKPSIGFRLDSARQFSDAPELYAVMLVILVIGILVDAVFFGTLERRVRSRYGLVDQATGN